METWDAYRSRRNVHDSARHVGASSATLAVITSLQPDPYTGAITRWSAGRLDDTGFLTAARSGLFTALAAAATDDHRPQFLARLRALGRELETDAWHRTRR